MLLYTLGGTPRNIVTRPSFRVGWGNDQVSDFLIIEALFHRQRHNRKYLSSVRSKCHKPQNLITVFRQQSLSETLSCHLFSKTRMTLIYGFSIARFNFKVKVLNRLLHFLLWRQGFHPMRLHSRIRCPSRTTIATYRIGIVGNRAQFTVYRRDQSSKWARLHPWLRIYRVWLHHVFLRRPIDEKRTLVLSEAIHLARVSIWLDRKIFVVHEGLGITRLRGLQRILLRNLLHLFPVQLYSIVVQIAYDCLS